MTNRVYDVTITDAPALGFPPFVRGLLISVDKPGLYAGHLPGLVAVVRPAEADRNAVARDLIAAYDRGDTLDIALAVPGIGGRLVAVMFTK